MNDREIENIRRALAQSTNNDESLTPEKLREAGIECWTTSEMTEAFQVHGFAAPFVIVTRLSDGVKGSLQFRHHPRVYFSFKPQG